MAFLCPSRLGVKKRKRGYQSMLRRLTCDGNIESLKLDDLVKLSFYTPDSRRIILKNFTACAEHELSVKQAQKVNFVYSDGDWAYIATDEKRQGYIPLNICAKIGGKSGSIKNSAGVNKDTGNNRKISVESGGSPPSSSDVDDDSFSEWSDDSDVNDTSDVTLQERGVAGMTVHNGQPIAYVRSMPYDRSPIIFEAVNTAGNHNSARDLHALEPADFDNPPSPTGIYRVLYDYKGTDMYDVTVQEDDIVFLLDSRHPDWFWVQLPNGKQGYVPSNYIGPIDIHGGPSERQEHLEHTHHKHHHKIDKFAAVDHDTKHKTSNNGLRELGHDLFNHQKQPKVDTSKTTVPENCMYSKMSKERTASGSTKFDAAISKTDQNLANTNANSNEDGVKKRAPKKPPRTKKPNQTLSPRSVDSLDTTIESMDTSFVESDTNRDDLFDCRLSLQGQCGSPRNEIVNDKRGHRGHPDPDHFTKNQTQNQQSDNKTQRNSHRPSDKQRPLSLPVFKSYEEYRKGYFDEIFYEDNDNRFGESTDKNVVNVSEILRIRARKQRDIARAKMKNIKENSCIKAETNETRKSVPNMKQYLLDLPSTKLEKPKDFATKSRSEATRKWSIEVQDNRSRNCVQSNHDHSPTTFKNGFGKPGKTDKNTERGSNCKQEVSVKHYGSALDLRCVGVEEKKHKKQATDETKLHRTTVLKQYSSTSDLRKNEFDQHETFRQRSNTGSQNIRHSGQGEKLDWFFGYPRKTKQSQSGTEKNSPASNPRISHHHQELPSNREEKHQRNKSRHTGANEESFMMELLRQSGDLLGKSEALLHSDTDEYDYEDSEVFETDTVATDTVYGDEDTVATDTVYSDGETVATDTVYSDGDSDLGNDKCSSFLSSSTIGITGMGIKYKEMSDIEKEFRCQNIPDFGKYAIHGNTAHSANNHDSENFPEDSVDGFEPELDYSVRSSLLDVRGVTEFVCQTDYEPEADNELPLKNGEIVHVGLDGQDSHKWYWAFSPRLKKYGFVKRKYVKIPMVTII